MVRQLRYVPIIADTGAGVNTQKLVITRISPQRPFEAQGRLQRPQREPKYCQNSASSAALRCIVSLLNEYWTRVGHHQAEHGDGVSISVVCPGANRVFPARSSWARVRVFFSSRLSA